MQALSVEVQSWPGVIAATHWHFNRPNEVNGADFYVGTDELGHIHLDGEVHLATSIELREALLEASAATAVGRRRADAVRIERRVLPGIGTRAEGDCRDPQLWTAGDVPR